MRWKNKVPFDFLLSWQLSYQKVSKSVDACRSYSKPKQCRFFETQCIYIYIYTHDFHSQLDSSMTYILPCCHRQYILCCVWRYCRNVKIMLNFTPVNIGSLRPVPVSLHPRNELSTWISELSDPCLLDIIQHWSWREQRRGRHNGMYTESFPRGSVVPKKLRMKVKLSSFVYEHFLVIPSVYVISKQQNKNYTNQPLVHLFVHAHNIHYFFDRPNNAKIVHKIFRISWGMYA